MIETTNNIKMMLATLNNFVPKMNDDQVNRMMEILADVSTEIAEAETIARIDGKEYKPTNEPGEMLERIRIRLYCNQCNKELKKIVKPR